MPVPRAATDLGTRARLCASDTTKAGNGRAIGAYRRAGFVEEGRLRQACFRNGRYHDELCLGILRGDWERQVQSDDDEAVEQEGSPVLEPAAMTMWDLSIER